MPNYGEELVYWYLRLNGFFPINNFIIHRSSKSDYNSDIDLIAIRLPNVYEEIGGQDHDWDGNLFMHFKNDLPIGVISEVKTGDLNKARLFQETSINYAAGRFGFTKEYNKLSQLLNKEVPIVETEHFQVAKILFSNRDYVDSNKFLHIPIRHVRDFIKLRIEKYPTEKFGSRMFFPSSLLQNLIDSTVNGT